MKGLKNIETFLDRHGRRRWYFGRTIDGKKLRVPMPPPGTPEFDQKYQKLLHGSYEDAAVALTKLRTTRGAIAKVRRMTKDGFVYAAVDGALVKIGFTKNPAARLRNLRTGAAGNLAFYVLKPGSKADEAALHRRFANAHVAREWFERAAEVEAWIAANKNAP